MVIRVLTFDGCPNRNGALELVRRTVSELDLHASIEAVEVRDEGEAGMYNFHGSPTVQVDGRDIEARRRDEASSLTCRIYGTPDGFAGVPPRQMLVDAIREALQASPSFRPREQGR
jgi:hypothetical protein